MNKIGVVLRHLAQNPYKFVASVTTRSFFMGQAPSMISEGDALKGRDDEMSITNKHYILGNPIKGPFADGLQVAVFATGCFWGTEKGFWRMPGVYSTSVGYAGGYTKNPTYEEVCSQRTGHTEVVQVVYDQNKISYTDLLRLFWESHDPTQANGQGNDKGTQYRSAIYTYSQEQKALAEASMAAYEKELLASGKGMGSKIITEIDSDKKYYFAEDYHQQYLAKPGSRQYCSAMPTTQKMAAFELWCPDDSLQSYAPKLPDAYWNEHGPKPHCTIKGPNDQIKWP